MVRALIVTALALTSEQAHAFTLDRTVHDWQDTERFCVWVGGTCTFAGTSNDTAGAATLLPTLGAASTFDSDGYVASNVLVFGSSLLTLSHGTERFQTIFPSDRLRNVYAHVGFDAGANVSVDVDWFRFPTTANTCVDMCLDDQPIDARLTVQPDWKLDFMRADQVVLASVTGEGCVTGFATDGTDKLVKISDPTPAFVQGEAYGEGGGYYRLYAQSYAKQSFYVDADNDGYGAGAATVACAAPNTSYVTVPGDCADSDATRNPDGVERCNNLDDDCNGQIDNSVVYSTWYVDVDRDGFGDDNAVGIIACAPPGVGYAPQAGDCDDTVATTNHLGTESCDGVDNDCDGLVDDEVTWAQYWVDDDGDGAGDDAQPPLEACADPGAGYATNGDDCDDVDDGVYGGATETCDGVDEDCDGIADDGLPTDVWYPDVDGDGHGEEGASGVTACAEPPGTWSSDDLDCDDVDPDLGPDVAETCDGVDQDCDGTADEGVGSVWYDDNDEDGYGLTSTASAQSCEPPGDDGSWSVTPGDCDDGDTNVHPGAVESCNGVDDNCDAAIDENTSGLWYPDEDGDGFGDPTQPSTECAQGEGYVANATDCDDADATVLPGGAEVCGGLDENCDGAIDELCPNPGTCGCGSTGVSVPWLGIAALLLVRRRGGAR